jgi:hypothetical protein
MTLDEIREALRAPGLERLADVAERLTLPAIRIKPTMVDGVRGHAVLLYSQR